MCNAIHTFNCLIMLFTTSDLLTSFTWFWCEAIKTKIRKLLYQNITVLDGTLMPPSTRFTKIWRMQNNGTTRWPYRTKLVWAGGDKFANKDYFDVAVDLTSPAVPCLVGIFHIGDWRHLLVKCLDNEFGFILRWISLNQTLLLEVSILI
uniref:Nbr1 FW domain-containing protein n=1 Tax=Musa acuminata subsp. malaccensis TaxID=214687 RepID=A0A804HMR5_MUSAM